MRQAPDLQTGHQVAHSTAAGARSIETPTLLLATAPRNSVAAQSGASWAAVCQETGLSKGTAQRAAYGMR